MIQLTWIPSARLRDRESLLKAIFCVTIAALFSNFSSSMLAVWPQYGS